MHAEKSTRRVFDEEIHLKNGTCNQLNTPNSFLFLQQSINNRRVNVHSSLSTYTSYTHVNFSLFIDCECHFISTSTCFLEILDIHFLSSRVKTATLSSREPWRRWNYDAVFNWEPEWTRLERTNNGAFLLHLAGLEQSVSPTGRTLARDFPFRHPTVRLSLLKT